LKVVDNSANLDDTRDRTWPTDMQLQIA